MKKGQMTNRAVAVVDSGTVTKTANLFDGDLVSRWLKFLGRSQKTCQSYTTNIKQLLSYFKDNGIVQPRREDLENWRDSLIQSGKAASTIAAYITTAKRFFQFLYVEGLYENVAAYLANGVKLTHSHKRAALSAVEVAKLFAAIKGDNLKAKQTRAILAILSTTGARTIEIARADVADLRREGGVLYLYVQGKGHSQKDAKLKISDKVYALIQDYLSARGAVNPDSPLFTSCARRNFGQRISTETIRKTIKALLRSIGLDGKQYSAHSLRHSAITLFLLNGSTLQEACLVARHSSISVTQIYAHDIDRMKANAELKAADSIFNCLDLLGGNVRG